MTTAIGRLGEMVQRIEQGMPAGRKLLVWSTLMGLSRKELAARIGVHKWALTRVLYGKGKPGARSRISIAQLTGDVVPVEAWDEDGWNKAA